MNAKSFKKRSADGLAAANLNGFWKFTHGFFPEYVLSLGRVCPRTGHLRNFVETGHFQRKFDKVFRQGSTTKLGTSLSGQALEPVPGPRILETLSKTLSKTQQSDRFVRQSFRQRPDYALLGQAPGNTATRLYCRGTRRTITAIPPGGSSQLRIESGSPARHSQNANDTIHELRNFFFSLLGSRKLYDVALWQSSSQNAF